MESSFTKERIPGESQEVIHGWQEITMDRRVWAFPGVQLALEKFI